MADLTIANEALRKLLEREGTGISWADLTFNPWIGCTRVSPACDNCYAETLATNRLGVHWGPHADRRRTAASTWAKPLRWDRIAADVGVQLRVFCASLADVFDNKAPQEWREDLWRLIRATPNLTWMLLTKRPQNIDRMLPGAVVADVPANVWLGTTAEDQPHAEQRVGLTQLIAGAFGWIPFVSAEPLLGPLDLTRIRTGDGRLLNALTGELTGGGIVAPLGLVIAGGESGPDARPSHPDWIRALRDQCDGAVTPFHFKQWGEYLPEGQLDAKGFGWAPGQDGRVHWWQPEPTFGDHLPDGACSVRIGTKRAGRRLDGVIHDGLPDLAREIG
ncbi:phage Gp37/Gp68 family protein [Sphingomonas koreensis]|uniref:phage Gp37/Gp68 family protein n=1 Tax=Sphingomonas koreensis TaxID=93064 RepID=UPI000F7F5C63|nr:phage Gp37/Gp68 family protein [Sphingomonas koreensis]MDC7808823.1 phage Gp37/Gp68 family protein [Sphingomonas koreensis]RSU98962.1 phage Gp37/Gp68 family protein [Sphingomonas koreensis]